MPARDRHPPSRNLGWAELADPAVAEGADGLPEQPT